jgi:TRAP transporter TAXI family solute receptor
MRSIATSIGALAVAFATATGAQTTTRISITTGGTGGVYYPLGGGMANILSKHVPGLQATAEVTGGSIDNLRLVGSGKSEVAFTMADAAWDAVQGKDKFNNAKVNARALMVLYPNIMHVVTVEATGIKSMQDLKGKRISTGSPGSGTEVMSNRLLEASGIDAKDFTRERLGVAESVNALKDRKIDAFTWVGGLPTGAVSDLAATPGMKIHLIDHAAAVDGMNKKYGPLYVKGSIPARTYQGQDAEATTAVVWNILVTSDKTSDRMAYDIVKTLFEKKADLVAVHKDASWIDLKWQSVGSPIPFHPGARKYLEERGVKFSQ